ncbi:MAG: tetratricopeptide repeat protein [Patescibacteria group bacterium]|mgnify:CR=1 FL=1
MLVDWILLGVFAASVAACAVVVWRKLPQLASIRIEAIPKHQHQLRKQQILDKRLQQKLGNVEAVIAKGFASFFRGVRTTGQNIFTKLTQLEREYRRKIVVQQAIDDPDALRAKVAAALTEAQTAVAAGDWPRAEQHFVDVVSLDPKNIDAYLGLADAATARKDYVNAREALKFVLKLQQDSDVAYARLGNIDTQEGKFAEAEADYLKSVSLNALTAGTHYELGVTEENLGNIDKAETAYQEAVKLEPANPKYLDALLQFALTSKRKNLAKAALEKLQAANPENQKLEELAQAVKEL